MNNILKKLVGQNYQQFHQASDDAKKRKIVENIREVVYGDSGDSTSSSLSKQTNKVRTALRDRYQYYNNKKRKKEKNTTCSKERSRDSLHWSAVSYSLSKELIKQKLKETNSVLLTEGNIQQSKEVGEEGEKGIEREEEQKEDNLDISPPIHHSNPPAILDNSVPCPPIPNCSPLRPTFVVDPNIETVQIHDATNSSSTSKVPNNSVSNERASMRERKAEVKVRVKQIKSNSYCIVLDPFEVPPSDPELPDNKWWFDSTSRVMHVKFNGVVTDQDKMNMLKMMERDDITVVSEGLIDETDMNNFSVPAIKNEAELFHHKKFHLFEKNEQGICSEIDGDYSMRISEYMDYLEDRNRTYVLKGTLNGKNITKEVDGKKTVIYLTDFEMKDSLRSMKTDFKETFKLPGLMPGGSHCMLKSVRRLCFFLIVFIHKHIILTNPY